MLQCTIAGGRTKGAYQKSFVFVHQHGCYYVTWKPPIVCDKNGFVGMCQLGVNQLITVYHFSLLCEMDESTSRFRIPNLKLLTRKRRLLSILFRNLRFTRTNGRYRFFENQWTFGYCIQISKDLDTISKSLKIFIQFFMGYPNTCTWCSIQAVICSWLYELWVWESCFYRLNWYFPSVNALDQGSIIKNVWTRIYLCQGKFITQADFRLKKNPRTPIRDVA